MYRLSLLMIVLVAACSGPIEPVESDLGSHSDLGLEQTSPLDFEPGHDLSDLAMDLRLDEDLEPDNQSSDLAGDETSGPACAPGEGCFLDPCLANDNCQSGWCVEHMGDSVCTVLCQEECPPGWSCKAVGSGGPDVNYVCVSQVSNLCKPCSNMDGCKSVGLAEDVCVDYGDEGSFCGSKCATDDDCPWGFSCLDTMTVDGIATRQCVADAGVCPCAGKSVELALWTPCAVENDFGSCPGKRICTAEGLTDCDALPPAFETCNGLDDDCDGMTDEPTEEGGDFVNLCDDGNECTEDDCGGEDGCTYSSLTGTECKDGDICTAADHCEEGVCVGSLVLCDDNDPCTDDGCDETGGCLYTFNKDDCDDNDPCTVADECTEGICSGYAVDCQCQNNADCLVLEDGDVCNGTLVCDTSVMPYQCVVDPATIVTCPEPDGIDAICLQPTCDPDNGSCSFTSDHDDYACSDGDWCTVGDVCESGVCLSGPALPCDDGSPCTTDTCSPGQGCVHTPTEGACDDKNPCTTGEFCVNSYCGAGEPLDCDDNKPCTLDGCHPVTGCTHEFSVGPCDDGNPCTINDSCVNGSCTPGPAVACDDVNPCTDDSCGVDGLCLHVPGVGLCDDGNLCTLGDHCEEGKCVSSGLTACDDDNICTTDSCDPAIGCLHLLNEAPCDDDNVCTTGDHCHLGTCIASGEIACNDINLCTDDACDPAVGCIFTANVASCDDSNSCTKDDNCADGMCIGSKLVDCTDDNPCTTDGCDATTGCFWVNNTQSCDDGNACTTTDNCSGGQCIPGPALVCNDMNGCTDDSCDSQFGCVSTANASTCNDSNACTENDVCAEGQCAGTALVCDDNNVCTVDSCDPATGCTAEVIIPCCGNDIIDGGEDCDDGNQTAGDGCDDQCQSENDSGCADGASDQIFQSGVMVACDGTFTGMQLATACGPGWHPANPNEYFSYGGTTVKPTQIRWVDTTWNAQGHDVPLAQWQGYYDKSNSSGWQGLNQNDNCTWVSTTEVCHLTFVNHNYGSSNGCHCRGGNPTSATHGVICVNNNHSKPRL